MLFTLFLKGILIGFLSSVPLGPISVLIVQRTVTRDRRAGFFSGAGAAFSDSTYFTIAVLSLSAVISFIREHEVLFSVLGAVILFLLGVYVFFSDPETRDPGTWIRKSRPWRLIVSTFLLTVTNPLIIFPYLGIFAGTGIMKNISAAWQPLMLVPGFLAGACGWWFTLTGIVSHLHGRFNFSSFRIFNRISGTAILLFSATMLIVSLLKHS